MGKCRTSTYGTPFLSEGKHTVEGFPVIELGVEGAGRGIVVQLDQSWMVLPQDLSHKHSVREISSKVSLWPAERNSIDPLEQLLHFVLVDRGRLHQRTIGNICNSYRRD